MKDSIFRSLLICAGLYMIPVLMTVFIQKQIPESDGQTSDSGISIYTVQQGEMVKMDMEEYLIGAVAAQISKDYPLEAIKAQTVLARTQVMNKLGTRREAESTGLGQAYMTKSQMQSRYGEDYGQRVTELTEAVKATKGKILSYEGGNTLPLFFTCSAGKTRNSEDIWGSAITGLIAVDSPEDTECDDYHSEKAIDIHVCIAKLKKAFSDFEADAKTFKDTVQVLEKDGSGYVTRIQMGNREFSGEDIREALSLASASFDFSFSEHKILFDVKGCGHGAGLSQWGARCMALEGKTWEEILLRYFPNYQLSEIFS